MFSLLFYTDMPWLPSRIPFQLIQRQPLKPRIHRSYRIPRWARVSILPTVSDSTYSTVIC